MRAATYSKKLLACAAAALLVLLPAGPAFGAQLANAQGAVAEVIASDGTGSYYATLPEAVDAAADGSTVRLLADTELAAYTASNGRSLSLETSKPLTIDGDGHTVTLHGLGIYMSGGADEASTYNIVMRDLTLVNSDANGRCVSARDGYKTMTFDDVVMKTTGSGNTQAFTAGGNTPQVTKINFNACTLESLPAGYGIVTFNPVDLTLADTDVTGYAAIYLKGPDSSAGSSGSTVNVVEGSTLTGVGIAGSSNVFGTVVLEGCKNVTVNVKNSTVVAKADDAQPPTAEAVVMYSTYANDEDSMAADNTVTFGEGSTVRAIGANSVLAHGNTKGNTVNATAGNYELQGDVFDAPSGTSGVNLVVTGGSWNKDMADYTPDGYATSHEANSPYVVAQKESQTDGSGQQAVDPTQPATPSGTTPDSTAKATDVATPSGSAKAADATSQASDPNARANVQQTGDAELPLVAGAAVVIAAASIGLLMRRRMEGARS